jgi:uncharacterized membrane protein
MPSADETTHSSTTAALWPPHRSCGSHYRDAVNEPPSQASAEGEARAERLVLFTDAVAAIAITLLVLPLVDAVPEAIATGEPSIDVFTENWPQIFSFLLSFFVISRLWSVHHQLFDGVVALRRGVLTLNMLWVLTIVALPFATELTGGYGEDRFAVLFYLGTILASSICLAALGVAIRGRLVVGSAIATGLLAVAFLLAVLVPATGYLGLLLLILTPLVERVWQRWHPDEQVV